MLTSCKLCAYICAVIKTFINKALADLWSTGKTAKIDAKMHRRILRALERLNLAATPDQMNAIGYQFHPLKGFKPTRYSVHINGPWCITFEHEKGDAWRVDFVQYH